MNKIYTKKDLDAELKKSKSVLALFYSSWCPFCLGFVPTFDRKVISLGIKNVVHVLLDDYDNPLWDEYDIPAVPTIVLFEEGKVCKRLDARLGRGLSEECFNSWIEEFKSS
jgi:thiol-disulfide isomerase/thioredoxin